jgi:cytochrome c oxidase subunit 4
LFAFKGFKFRRELWVSRKLQAVDCQLSKDKRHERTKRTRAPHRQPEGLRGHLLCGTATTVWASYVDLGIWNPIIALAIACTKATLVVLFFMHVKYSTKLTKLTIFAGLFLFLALIGMTLSDYISRAWGSW